MLHRILATRDDLLPLIARVAVGAVMFMHGAQKLLGWFGGKGWSGTMHFFTDWGFPAALVVALIITESIGMISLIAGFLGRVWAAGGIVIMIVAVWKAHSARFFMNWYAEPRGEGFEFHILAAALFLIVLIAGSGKLSIDRLLRGRLRDAPPGNDRGPLAGM